MAKRLLRDWTDSELMDKLSFEAEVFFTRLIMRADDFGSYHSNPKLLKAALFPLKEVTYQQIGQWVHECIEVDLIFLYEAEGKEFIRIKKFDQRLRNKRNAFPHPVSDPPQVAASRRDPPPEERREEKKEDEVEVDVEGEDARAINEKVSRETKSIVFDELFGDEIYIEQLIITHKGKDIKQAFEECYTHHSNAPNPPRELWEWKRKLNTWLSNTKTPKKYASSARTLTETSPAPGKDYSERF